MSTFKLEALKKVPVSPKLVVGGCHFKPRESNLKIRTPENRI